MTEYWFARYRPSPLPQNQSRGIIALGWQGRAVIAGFVLSMIVGGLLMLFFGLRDQMLIGVPLFIVFAAAGGATFIWASVAKSDPAKPASEYLAERQAQRAARRSA